MRYALSLFLVLGSAAYADKYDRLEAYYEKQPKLEATAPSSHHVNLKHELFYDAMDTEHASLKGTGRGWRGSYEYAAPNKPYFALEGAYSTTGSMNWDGVAFDSVPHSMKDKVRGMPEIILRDLGRDENYKLFERISNCDGNAAFVFNGCRYYSKDLIDNTGYIDSTHGDVLELNNDWMTGGKVDKESVGKHFGNNIRKTQGNGIRSIRFNGKEYYRIKDSSEEKEVLRSSLGSVSKTLADLSMKAGTSLSFDKALFTPFAGLGYRSVKTVESLRLLGPDEQTIVDSHPELHLAGINDTCYASWGAKGKYSFSPWFDLGLTGQVNHGLFYKSAGFAPEHDKGLFSFVGYRASLPVSLHLGGKVKYNLEAEPYMEQFDVGRKETNTGIRFSTGISF